MWVKRPSTVEWAYLKTQTLLVILKTRNQPQGDFFCSFGSRTFVPVNWMCKEQSSVSHSSTESEIISVDAGLRMDGLLALDLWDIVIQVLQSPQTNKKPSFKASGNGSVMKASGNGSEIPKVQAIKEKSMRASSSFWQRERK